MPKLYLGFDAGTQSVKAACFDTNFNEIASFSTPTKLYYPQPGWVEMDANEYFDALLTSIKGLNSKITKLGFNPKDIAGIMGDGIICGIVGIDEDGNTLTPYINYLDSRTQEDAENINAKNLDIWAKETGNSLASPMFPALIARWLIANKKQMRDSGAKFVHNAPFMLMKLAGLKAKDAFIDWGAMSGWGLGYKVEEKKWSHEQLSILGIDPKYMPRIVKPWDIVGYLTEDVAQETNLKPGIPILAGAGDTMQSMLGCGISQAGLGVDVAGTCAMFCVSTSGIVPELSQKDSGLIFNSGTLENTYFYWGFVRTGGLALRWFKDNVCDAQNNPQHYSTLSEKASKLPTGNNGVLFLPYLTGGTGEEKNASGAFLNLTMDDSQASMWRAVLEGIGYDYMRLAKNYKKAGVNLTQITVTEGGSKDNLWNQIKADMLDSTVIRQKKATGATLTNAVTLAFSLGDINSITEALNKVVEVDCRYSPNKDNHEHYEKIFALRENLIKKDMLSCFETLTKMRN